MIFMAPGWWMALLIPWLHFLQCHHKVHICGFDWKVSAVFGWIAVRFGSHIHFSPRRKWNNYVDSLHFNLPSINDIALSLNYTLYYAIKQTGIHMATVFAPMSLHGGKLKCSTASLGCKLCNHCESGKLFPFHHFFDLQATEKTVDIEDLGGHQAVFQHKTTHMQLTLAFHHFLANNSIWQSIYS